MGILFDTLFSFFKHDNAKEEPSEEYHVLFDHNPQTIEECRPAFCAHGYESLFEKVKPLFRPAIDISLTEKVEETILMSKLGDSPDLEKDIEWPVDANNIPQSFWDKSTLRKHPNLTLMVCCLKRVSCLFLLPRTRLF